MTPRPEVRILCQIPLIAEAIGSKLAALGLPVFRAPLLSGSLRSRQVLLAVGSGAHMIPPAPTAYRGLGIVYLSLEPTLHCLLEAIQLEAAAILPPDTCIRNIAAVIGALFRGAPVERPDTLLEAIPLTLSSLPARTVPLTRRQLEIGCSLAKGKSYEQVAAELRLTPHAISFHLRRLMEITGFRDRWEITAWFNEPLPVSVYPAYPHFMVERFASVPGMTGAAADHLPLPSLPPWGTGAAVQERF